MTPNLSETTMHEMSPLWLHRLCNTVLAGAFAEEPLLLPLLLLLLLLLPPSDALPALRPPCFPSEPPAPPAPPALSLPAPPLAMRDTPPSPSGTWSGSSTWMWMKLLRL